MGKLPDFGRYASIVDLVDDWAGLKSGSVIFIVEGEHGAVTWTGADLIRRSRLAAFRRMPPARAGRPSSDVAHNKAELGAAYVGLWRLRATPVPLDHRFSPGVMSRIAANADTTLAIADEPDRLTGLEGVKALALDELVADPSDDLPLEWSAQLDSSAATCRV